MLRSPEFGEPTPRSGGPFLVLDEHGGMHGPWRHLQPLLLQELHMLLHPPSRLVQTILDGVAYSRESFQVRGIEPKEARIVGGFDDQGIAEIEHRSSFTS